MARIRTVKPEFWKHEGLSALPEATHLLAGALLNYADDEGYFNANPALVKAECSPLREPSVSIHDSLITLSKQGYLRLGTAPDGRRYGQVINFSEHQRINRATPSKIKMLRILWDDSLSPHTQLTEPSHPEWKGMEGNGREQGSGNGKEARAHSEERRALGESERMTEFSAFWDAYPKGGYTDRHKLNAEHEYWNRRDEGVSAETLRINADAYRAQTEALRKTPFNPDRWLHDGHWRGPFEIPKRAEDTPVRTRKPTPEEDAEHDRLAAQEMAERERRLGAA